MSQPAFRPPRPARVNVRGGAPASVSRRPASGWITEAAGPWRASGDWWDVAWSREEWDVAVEGRGLFRIFRDRLREEWFVDAEYDHFQPRVGFAATLGSGFVLRGGFGMSYYVTQSSSQSAMKNQPFIR